MATDEAPNQPVNEQFQQLQHAINAHHHAMQIIGFSWAASLDWQALTVMSSRLRMTAKPRRRCLTVIVHPRHRVSHGQGGF